MPDRLAIAFEERNESGSLVGKRELPMTVALLGDFSPAVSPKNGQSIEDSVAIERKTFNNVFRQFNPSIVFEVQNLLSQDDRLVITLTFSSMAAFHPNVYLSKIPEIVAYSNFITKLVDAQGRMTLVIGDVFVADELSYLHTIAKNETFELTDSLNVSQIIRYSAIAKKLLNQQVQTIVYNKQLQQLEYLWAGTLRLVQFTTQLRHCKIVLLHAHKQALEEDAINHIRATESDLFYQIYSKELDQFGGEPISMLLNTFSMSIEDTDVLAMFAEVGRLSSCPVISAVEKDFFALSDLSILENEFDFEEYKKGKNFRTMRAISKKQSARFLGFLLNSICLRAPFTAQDVDSIPHLQYEDIAPVDYSSGGLWGTPVFAFITFFLRFYEEHGHCGALENTHSYFDLTIFNLVTNQALDWSPTALTQRKLADFGVMSFRYVDTDGARIGLGDMVMFNVNNLDDINSVDLIMHERINVYLPQLLFVAQLHHYLRLIQRQSFAREDHKALKKELLNWLKQYISDTYMSSDLVRLHRPLKSVDLKMHVDKDGDVTNRLHFSLSITPHSPYRGLEYSVSL